MGKIFDMNNPVWQFIGKLVDAFVLHVLWLVCSIPLVTFGASTAALHYAMMKDVADEDPHFVRAFFRSFKENLKQGIFMGLIFLVVGVLLAFAIRYYFMNTGTIFMIARGISIFMAIVYVLTLQYAFALLARFVNTTPRLIQNAFFMSIRHLGWSVVMVFIFAAVYFVIFFVGFLPLLLLGYGLVVYLDSYILNRIFKPYIKEAMGDDYMEDKDPDAWEIPEDMLPAQEDETKLIEGAEAETGAEAESLAEEAAEIVEKTSEEVAETAEETAAAAESAAEEVIEEAAEAAAPSEESEHE